MGDLIELNAKVISINTHIKRKSSDILESIQRVRRYYVQNRHGYWLRKEVEEFTFDLTANIEYWKKHGKLPNNTDLSKVQGKGMYSNKKPPRR